MEKRPIVHFILVMFLGLSVRGQLNNNSFPDDFLFGTATSAYQIEGAWNESGKGENIWDHYTHENPDLIRDKSNGDMACDSYHKFKEDILLMKNMGIQFYRFSLSWSRILPTGFVNKINQDGIRYYNELIDELLKNEIIPMVTIFHWDTPQPLQDLGGFTSELMVHWFENYARVAFENFGDRVKLWLTFNEPKQTCLYSYGYPLLAPGFNSSGYGDYLCAHNLLKAHARAYHVYDKEFRPRQKGRISITMDTLWYEPVSQSKADIAAAQRVLDFEYSWYADPIFHPNGDYPQVMKDRIGERSKAEGFSESRLPKFTEEEVKYIRGTYDYLGLNHYTTQMAADKPEDPIGEPGFKKDHRVQTYFDPSWEETASSWFKVVPWGFRKLLKYIKNRYGDVEIHITENGFSDKGDVQDHARINYYRRYLSVILDAMHEDKVNVKSYAAWSFLDNFEWRDGYVNRFGLFHVNFDDQNKPRTPKASAHFYKAVITTRKIPSSVGRVECANTVWLLSLALCIFKVNAL